MAGIPNGNTLKNLPLRALVAYAARCAQRVVPYFSLPPGHPAGDLAEEAVQEAAQASLEFVAGTLQDLEPARLAEERVVHALMAVSEGESPDTQAALSCNAAYAAVNAAVLAIQSVKAPSRATEGSKVIAAAVTAADAALVVDPDIRHKMIRDYQILCRLNLGRFPDWGRAFDASEEGTLGPLQLTRDAETAQKRKSLIHV